MGAAFPQKKCAEKADLPAQIPVTYTITQDFLKEKKKFTGRARFASP